MVKKILLLIVLILSSFFLFSQTNEELIQQLKESNEAIELLIKENDELLVRLEISTKQLEENNVVLSNAYKRIEDDAIEIANLRRLLAATIPYVKTSRYALFILGGFNTRFDGENLFSGGIGFNIKLLDTPINILTALQILQNGFNFNVGIGYSF